MSYYSAHIIVVIIIMEQQIWALLNRLEQAADVGREPRSSLQCDAHLARDAKFTQNVLYLVQYFWENAVKNVIQKKPLKNIKLCADWYISLFCFTFYSKSFVYIEIRDIGNVLIYFYVVLFNYRIHGNSTYSGSVKSKKSKTIQIAARNGTRMVCWKI